MSKQVGESPIDFLVRPHRVRREDDPAPRYEHWCRCAQLPVSTLACLLLDIDPDSLLGKYFAEAWDSGAKAFDQNLRNWPWIGKLQGEARDVRVYFDSAFRDGTFSRYDFLETRKWFAWARDLGLQIPTPFGVLIDTQSRANLERRCSVLQAQVLALEQRLSQRSDSVDLNPKERSTLVRLVALLVKQYAYDPARKSEAPGKIKRMLDTIDAGMDEKTIRKWLSEAAESVPKSVNKS